MKQALLIKSPFVIVDSHETEEIVKKLREKGIVVVRKKLEVGDFVIGDIGIERKSSSDFLNSIVDGRIFEQVKNLKENYEKCIIIVEGNFWRDLRYREIKENVVRGTILSLIVDFDAKIIFTRNLDETIEYLYLLAKRQQKRYYSIGKRKKEDPRILVLMGFPGIGKKLAEKLLEKFGSLERIFKATYPEIKSVLGEERALKFFETLKKAKDHNL